MKEVRRRRMVVVVVDVYRRGGNLGGMFGVW